MFYVFYNYLKESVKNTRISFYKKYNRIFFIKITRLKLKKIENQFGKYIQKMKNEWTKIKKAHSKAFKPIIEGGKVSELYNKIWEIRITEPQL